MTAALRGLVGAAALAAAGCVGPYQNVRVTSRPDACTVYLDGQPIGTTPLVQRISRTKDHAIYVKRDGYKPQLVVLELVHAPDGIHFFMPPDVDVALSRPRGEGERDLEIELDPAGRER